MLFAFDLMFLSDDYLRSKHLIERKDRLQELLAANPDQKVIRFHDHLDVTRGDVIDIACQMKLEGIIFKRLPESYVFGRTGIWTKAKCRATQHAWIPDETIRAKCGRRIVPHRIHG